MKSLKQIITVFILGLILPSCVQEARNIKIKFSVDMNESEDVQEVGIIGQFEPLSWSEPLPLSDPDGDRIFETELNCEVYYNYMEFKFVKHGNVIELEGLGNRQIQLHGNSDSEYHAIFDVNGALNKPAE